MSVYKKSTDNPYTLAWIQINAMNIKAKHTREVYTFFDLMGDVGGMLGFMTYMLSFIL